MAGARRRSVKLWVQLALALFVALYLWKLPMTSELRFPNQDGDPQQSRQRADAAVLQVSHPGRRDCRAAITVLTIVGSSNAVNLTDGLDGLAIGCTLITSVVFLVLTYLASNFKYAAYLQIPYVDGAGELTVFCAAMIGAGLGFLWFNCHPAQVFMGDTGSLALGGALGLIAVLIHQPFVLVIAGRRVRDGGRLGDHPEAAGSNTPGKRFGAGRRIFLMAPIHHHFEKKGWYESQVVMRFYILCVLFAVVALSTLKIR